MKHFATPEFWASRAALPAAIRQLADRSFERLERDPSHLALRLKKVGRYWSVRVGLHYRALAVRDEDDLIWFWIGTHAEYDRLTR